MSLVKETDHVTQLFPSLSPEISMGITPLSYMVPLRVTMLMILKLNSAYRETDEVVTAVHVVLIINLELFFIEALFSQSSTDSQKHI